MINANITIHMVNTNLHPSRLETRLKELEESYTKNNKWEIINAYQKIILLILQSAYGDNEEQLKRHNTLIEKCNDLLMYK